jgi:16S rRNA (cytosine967-C5)-methyltransferase
VSRYFSHLNTAVSILAGYKGDQPFSHFLKSYFSLHKKYGSSDRKNITHLCYVYFRTGQLFADLPVSEKIILSLFLCSSAHDPQLAFHRPDLDEKTGFSIAQKFELLGTQHEEQKIFPWLNETGADIEKRPFAFSHLIQPDLFLRCRPGQKDHVKQKLNDQEIRFIEIMPGCLAVDNATKIEGLLSLNKEVVVQDLSSQRVADLMDLIPRTQETGSMKIWDCCAASGGKSILAKDILGNVELTVSDIRKSVLVNLQKRFSEAGIDSYKSFTADLSKPVKGIPPGHFDLVIADLPCTGSGTWSRAPEHLRYFNEEKLELYAGLQKKILGTVFPHIKKDGYLLYCTCSVFEKENDGVVTWILEQPNTSLMEKKYFKGYDKKADTLFGALVKIN